ncbi:hypothetical protein EJ08DRAFT_694912 [Tothia fuscella]|uniref:Uncharacterized protein n=1 Tax=Tothia fuscella TaxID=1048955 RepID=A0A9P4NWB9_9PEZI|nr:hypothetical protein EJ08DRAFT_694912 [Tothia fuscella]
MGDPRLRFLKEKHMVESRIRLWSTIHPSNPNERPLNVDKMWICTEPIPEISIKKKSLLFSATPKFNVKKHIETLVNQIAIHHSSRPLENLRQIRAQSSSWEKTKADRLFQRRFLGLPGEVRNLIYDELLEYTGGVSQETPLFRSYISGKTNHGGAQFCDALRLPVAHRQNLTFVRHNDPIWNELFDRWCAQVRFHLFEAFEVHLKPSFVSRNRRKAQCNLARYLDTDASQVFGSSSSWFFGMRTCSLYLSLFNIAALLHSGSRGMSALKAEVIEIVRVLKFATKLANLHISIRLWPSKYRDQSWKSWPPSACGKAVLDAFQPLQYVQGVERICVFAGLLMASEWHASMHRKTSEKFNVLCAMPDHMENRIEVLSDSRWAIRPDDFV